MSPTECGTSPCRAMCSSLALKDTAPPWWMDGLAGLGQRLAGTSRSTSDDLGQDREGGLLRCAATDVESARRRDPRQVVLTHAGSSEPVVAIADRTPTSQRADVAGRRVERGDDGRLVEL